jgi:glyoxylase I family protein
MIDHVNIVVSDIERSVDFYCRALHLQRGFERLLEGAWIERITGVAGVRAQCVFLEHPTGGARLELLQFLEPASPRWEQHGFPGAIGVRHIAWTVPNLADTVERLDAMGVERVSEPIEVPFAVGALGRKYLCYFHDPDGVLLEVASYE